MARRGARDALDLGRVRKQRRADGQALLGAGHVARRARTRRRAPPAPAPPSCRSPPRPVAPKWSKVGGRYCLWAVCPSCRRWRSWRGGSMRRCRARRSSRRWRRASTRSRRSTRRCTRSTARTIAGVRRRGKLLMLDVETVGGEPLTFCVHLMSAGRLQLFDKRASLRDRTSRLLLRLPGDRELRAARVRHEAGGVGRSCCAPRTRWRPTRRSAKPRPGGVAGPAGGPPPLRVDGRARCTRCCATSASSPASAARGSTRSCTRPSCRRSSAATTCPRREARRCAPRSSASSGGAIEHYEASSSCRSPTSSRCRCRSTRHQGEPCPRCGTELEAVYYEDYVMTYCPNCQTEGRVLKDRRLSRLLK